MYLSCFTMVIWHAFYLICLETFVLFIWPFTGSLAGDLTNHNTEFAILSNK